MGNHFGYLLWFDGAINEYILFSVDRFWVMQTFHFYEIIKLLFSSQTNEPFTIWMANTKQTEKMYINNYFKHEKAQQFLFFLFFACKTSFAYEISWLFIDEKFNIFKYVRSTANKSRYTRYMPTHSCVRIHDILVYCNGSNICFDQEVCLFLQ